MIPLVDLTAQYNTIKNEIKLEIDKVLSKGDFILGEAVGKFEESFSCFCDSDYCVGVSSGTDALFLSLLALGIGPGDEVITVANTFVATVLAISYTGAKPVLIDIDSKTFNLDLEKIEEKITPKTKAIMPVHLYGRAVDMERLSSLADKYHLKVVEDAAQAHGALYKGRKVGSFGIAGCFSFYPGKNLGAYGDAGCIVTSDKRVYEDLISLRNYGSPKKYYHNRIGYNHRLDTIQAAVLNVKLKYLAEWNKKRLNNAKIYNKKLKGIGDLIFPVIDDDDSCVFHLYVIRTKKRDNLLKYLKSYDIQCGIHYPVPIYSQEAYKHLGYHKEDFPVTENIVKEILSLPMYPELTEAEIDKIVSLIKNFYA
ncbi:MAG: DegT/DnrJ/EryC1/StrS family aminotransferase [Candidatus Omnitrophica bacterium]|jgi:dTDP-4-amino-4,6-dideoxygalactose transaminase|nr:DegT/DnrJ/EryC1/StrS family aminotransferase [Candidatus Omnitrophota bacterium]